MTARSSRITALLSAAASVALIGAVVTAPAAGAVPVPAKTITCYKGTAVKKVTATSPKCPSGWSTTKPKASPSPAAKGPVAFSATYKGNGTLVWSSSDVQAKNIKGTASSAPLGLTTLTGLGASNPQSSCAAIRGTGSLTGADGTVNFKIDTKSQACGEAESAPTNVTVNATATITGGTGKYVGATGSLKITGGFAIKTTADGAQESPAFTATVTGTITLK